MTVRVRGAERIYHAIAVAACVVLSACGSEGAPAAPTVIDGGSIPPQITSFEITAAPPAVEVPLPAPFPPHFWTVAGQSSQLTARVGVSGNPPADVSSNVEWRTTNGAVASVSPAGVFTGQRPGLTPLVAIYQRGSATTFFSVFDAPPTVGGPFTGLLQLRERKPYFVTVGASGGSIAFVLTSSGPGSGLLGVMFGFADATPPTCRPPYTYGPQAFQTQLAGTGNRSDARMSFVQSAPGRYCVIVLDPATVTAEDQVPPGANLNPMNFPVSYSLTVGVSGAGGSVAASGQTIRAGSIQ